MNCPKCNTHNDDGNRFCLKCGAPLKSQPAPPTSQISTASPTPPAPRPSAYASPQPYSYPPQPTYPARSFGAPSVSALNIWGPFAGYGARRRHVGWLMDGQGQRAQELLDTVRSKFGERAIPGAELAEHLLVAKGVLVETRPYFILKRGLASLALYIAQFGRDLFISQASYLKPPVSAFRVIIACVMLTIAGFMILIYPVAWGASGQALADSFDLFGGGPSDAAVAAFLSLTCIIGPLGGLNNVLLFVLLCYSGYKWLTAKDFLAALRVPPNEFNEDDLMAMEKAVEQTVRISLDEIGLNPDDLKPTAAGDGRRLI